MNTTDALHTVLARTPFIRHALSLGLVNISSLARHIKEDVEEMAFRDLTDSAIISALQRYADNLEKSSSGDFSFNKHIGSINVHSDICEITVSNSRTLNQALLKITEEVTNYRDTFFTYIKGSWQTTLIFEHELQQKVEQAVVEEDIVYSYKSLAKITVQLKNNHLEIPGIIAHILQLLAWNNINLIEVLSTSDELTVVVLSKDASAAFSVLNGLITDTQ